jgi:hypothetical protein
MSCATLLKRQTLLHAQSECPIRIDVSPRGRLEGFSDGAFAEAITYSFRRAFAAEEDLAKNAKRAVGASRGFVCRSWLCSEEVIVELHDQMPPSFRSVSKMTILG